MHEVLALLWGDISDHHGIERELVVVEVAIGQDPDQIIGVTRGRCINTEPA